MYSLCCSHSYCDSQRRAGYHELLDLSAKRVTRKISRNCSAMFLRLPYAGQKNTKPERAKLFDYVEDYVVFVFVQAMTLN